MDQTGSEQHQRTLAVQMGQFLSAIWGKTQQLSSVSSSGELASVWKRRLEFGAFVAKLPLSGLSCLEFDSCLGFYPEIRLGCLEAKFDLSSTLSAQFGVAAEVKPSNEVKTPTRFRPGRSEGSSEGSGPHVTLRLSLFARLKANRVIIPN